jgi:hypothetical protein
MATAALFCSLIHPDQLLKALLNVESNLLVELSLTWTTINLMMTLNLLLLLLLHLILTHGLRVAPFALRVST